MVTNIFWCFESHLLTRLYEESVDVTIRIQQGRDDENNNDDNDHKKFGNINGISNLLADNHDPQTEDKKYHSN